MKKQIRKNTVKQGRRSITITSTVDPERNLETRDIALRERGRTTHYKFEIDLTTGKLLPPPGQPEAPEDSMLAGFERAFLAYSEKALKDIEPDEE